MCHLQIHYEGWGDRYDTTLIVTRGHANLSRIAPCNTHCTGPYVLLAIRPQYSAAGRLDSRNCEVFSLQPLQLSLSESARKEGSVLETLSSSADEPEAAVSTGARTLQCHVISQTSDSCVLDSRFHCKHALVIIEQFRASRRMSSNCASRWF